MRVDVRHPVLFSGMKRSAGPDRVGYAHLVSAFELHAITAGEVDEVRPVAPGRCGYSVHDGGLWVKPEIHGDNPKVDEFVAWLRDGHTPWNTPRVAFGTAFAGTPLGLASGSTRGWGEVDIADGDAATADRAVARVAAYLDRNVRLCGEDVLIRSTGPAVRLDNAHLETDEFPGRRRNVVGWVRLDRASDVYGPAPDRGVLHDVSGLGAPYAGVPIHLVGEADILSSANVLPELVSRILEDYARFARWRGAGITIRAHRTVLLDLRLDGALGLLEGDEAIRALTLGADALRHAMEIHGLANAAASRFVGRGNPLRLRRVQDIVEYVERVALPRMEETLDATPEDVEALAGLRL